MKRHLLTLALWIFAAAANAGPVNSFQVTEDIDDVLFSIENEIIGRGLKVDHVNHVSDMLDRTQADVGATRKIYRMAQVLSFCSATLSREMMEADPANLQFCPYQIYVYATTEQPDVTIVGFDSFPEGEMKKVEALLESIVKDAIGID